MDFKLCSSSEGVDFHGCCGVLYDLQYGAAVVLIILLTLSLLVIVIG